VTQEGAVTQTFAPGGKNPRAATVRRTGGNVDTVESLLLSHDTHEDKPQSHRTVRKFAREAGDPLIISIVDYSQRSASQVL